MYQLKILVRSFTKHKSSSLINLIGLTLGLSCAFFIYLWVQDEYAMDAFHENDSQLFQVMSLETYANEVTVSDDTPGLLGQSLKADFPDIKYSVTTTWISKDLLTYEGVSLREDGYHVGKDFFNVFSYPLLVGNPNSVLSDNRSICISRDLAIKLFGSVENAINKTIQWRQGDSFSVTGVFENISDKSTSVFDYVLPLPYFLSQVPWANDWENSGLNTYVVLNEGANSKATSQKIEGYIKTKVASSHNDLFLKKYSEQYLYGNYTNGTLDGGRIEYVRLFSIIAIFILIIACINFMNLSTARASKRAKAVGIRKAIGARRNGLVWQYISEAVFISFIAMILSYVLVLILLGPFNAITGKNIVLSLTPQLIMMSIMTVVVTGVLAGSYPAFYLTHFSPIQVLKNGIKSSVGELWARKGLVVFQFAITIILIIGVVVIHRQTQFVNNKYLGYNQDNVVLFGQDGDIYTQQETFLNELRKVPGVANAAGTSHHMLGKESSNFGLEWEGKTSSKRVNFERFFVDYDFYNTMKFELAEGRWFDRAFTADSTKLVINETAAEVMGFSTKEAIGKRVKFGENMFLEIVGVVKDFHFTSLHERVDPAYFRMYNTWNVAVRIQAGKEAEALSGIQKLYEKFAPGYDFSYQFMDKGYQSFYESEKRVGTLSSYFASFAIIISCLGLFGLVAFSAERRVKEIGVRKVLGASVSNIIMMLSKDFIRLVLFSIIIAVPIAYLFMKEWLAQFAYRINLDIWVFLSAAIISLLIAWLTVGFQAFRAANVNPANSLRSE